MTEEETQVRLRNEISRRNAFINDAENLAWRNSLCIDLLNDYMTMCTELKYYAFDPNPSDSYAHKPTPEYIEHKRSRAKETLAKLIKELNGMALFCGLELDKNPVVLTMNLNSILTAMDEKVFGCGKEVKE